MSIIVLRGPDPDMPEPGGGVMYPMPDLGVRVNVANRMWRQPLLQRQIIPFWMAPVSWAHATPGHIDARIIPQIISVEPIKRNRRDSWRSVERIVRASPDGWFHTGPMIPSRVGDADVDSSPRSHWCRIADFGGRIIASVDLEAPREYAQRELLGGSSPPRPRGIGSGGGRTHHWKGDV